MLLTITFNPAIDKVYHCADLSLEGIHRAEKCRTFAAGKGINLSRGVRDLNCETLALGFAGGHLGRMLRELLAEEGIPEDLTETANEVRLNPTLRDVAAELDVHIIEPEQPISSGELQAFRQTFYRHLEHAEFVAFAGSCPPGAGSEFLREILDEASAAGVRTVIDSRDKFLSTAIQTKPWLIKPNEDELGHLADKAVEDNGEVLAAAKGVVDAGVEIVVVSLAERGALLVSSEGAWSAKPPEVQAINTVGCGDAMLAGLLVAVSEGAEPAEMLRRGVAAGTANTLCDTPGRIPSDIFGALLAEIEVSECTGVSNS